MLYYDRTDISEGTDHNKSNRSKEYVICYYFFNHGFKFQESVCSGFYNLTMLCLDLNDIAIITVKNVDYRCIIHNISKSEAINLLKIYVLESLGYM